MEGLAYKDVHVAGSADALVRVQASHSGWHDGRLDILKDDGSVRMTQNKSEIHVYVLFFKYIKP